MGGELLLDVEDLHVEIATKKVLKGINLRIREGETHIFFGPNGSGKTTLLNAIMGFASYRVTKGRIIFRGQDITSLPVNERAKMGIGMSFQRPPAIRGVRLKQLAELCSKKDGKLVERYGNILNLKELLEREVNVGFSGGEIKRAELLQLLLQEPVMVFLDEPESGVDLENIALIGGLINELLEKDCPIHERKCMGLIITHTGHILDYVNARTGYVMCDGIIGCEGDPHEILKTIKERGYGECVRCLVRRTPYA